MARGTPGYLPLSRYPGDPCRARARQPRGSPLQGRKVTMSSAVTVVSMSDSGDMDAPKYKSPRPDAAPPASIKPDADVAARFRAAASAARRRSHRGDAAHRVVKAPPPPAAVPVTPTRRTTWRRKAAPSTYDDAPSRNVVHPVTPPASPPKAPPPALELPPPLFLPPEPPTKADDDYWGHFLDLDPAEEQDSYWFSHTRAPVLSGQ